jgi:hypothetical protein
MPLRTPQSESWQSRGAEVYVLARPELLTIRVRNESVSLMTRLQRRAALVSSGLSEDRNVLVWLLAVETQHKRWCVRVVP